MEKYLTITSEEFLTTYSPKALSVQFKGVKGVKDVLCLPKEVNNLYGLRNVLGDDKVEALLKMQLIDLNEVLGLKQAFTERQIDEMAESILSMYSALTMADIYLVFKRIKTGFYGELYDRLPMPQLFLFFDDYFSERCEEAAKQSQAEADKYKSISCAQRSSDKNKETWHVATIINMQNMVKNK